jgi:hypothetical protein
MPSFSPLRKTAPPKKDKDCFWADDDDDDDDDFDFHWSD